MGKKGSFETVVKSLVKAGKDKGFLTYDEINTALPADNFTSEQIDDAMAALEDLGLQLVDKEDDITEEAEAKDAKKADGEKDGDYEEGGNISSDDSGRTDDPVRMYLREMGAVELLSREGEIAIAKRIEAGKALMISGICESPLAIESLIAWYDALETGDILLREVIDPDATYNVGNEPEEPEVGDDADVEEEDGVDADADDGADNDDETTETPENPSAEDEEDDESPMSLAAMEEELAPQVFEVFDKIKKIYKKMQKVQQERPDDLSKGKSPKPP